ncbi:MAG: hypothetical protein AB7G37_01120 [Solirubrobacteraceae bacterium]
MASPIRVTAEDPDTGDRQTTELPPGSYVVVCAEPRRVTHEQRYANGTVVITTRVAAAETGDTA